MQIPPLLAPLEHRNDNVEALRSRVGIADGRFFNRQSKNRKSAMGLLSPLVHDLFGIEWGAGFEENQVAIILLALENVCPADVFSSFC
jgi:hypothetical protein